VARRYFRAAEAQGLVRGAGISNVIELDWWESRIHMGLTCTWPGAALEPAYAVGPRRTLWGAWVIEHPQMRLLFGGDFGYSQDIADIGKPSARSTSRPAIALRAALVS